VSLASSSSRRTLDAVAASAAAVQAARLSATAAPGYHTARAGFEETLPRRATPNAPLQPYGMAANGEVYHPRATPPIVENAAKWPMAPVASRAGSQRGTDYPRFPANNSHAQRPVLVFSYPNVQYAQESRLSSVPAPASSQWQPSHTETLYDRTTMPAATSVVYGDRHSSVDRRRVHPVLSSHGGSIGTYHQRAGSAPWATTAPAVPQYPVSSPGTIVGLLDRRAQRMEQERVEQRVGQGRLAVQRVPRLPAPVDPHTGAAYLPVVGLPGEQFPR